MTRYGKGHYAGKIARILGLEAMLPDNCAQEFTGYCDGYQKKAHVEPFVTEIVEANISKLTVVN